MTEIARTLESIAAEELINIMRTPSFTGILLWAGLVALSRHRHENPSS